MDASGWETLVMGRFSPPVGAVLIYSSIWGKGENAEIVGWIVRGLEKL